jgi:apolipoprotein N-acyltransferase
VQHALLPRLRAIENRRPVVQAATSGVSQIIDDRGRVLADVPYRLNRRPARATLFREGTAQAEIVPNSRSSIYARGGYWFGPVVATVAGLALATATLRRVADPPTTRQ